MTSASSISEGAGVERFAADLRAALSETPPRIPSQYLYDPLGSALFEAICALPWYRVTRAETALLRAHGAEIHQQLAPLTRLVELGAGNGTKLRTLLLASPTPTAPPSVHLVDVSDAALRSASHALADQPIELVLHQAEYHAGLDAVSAGSHASGRSLALFLGSNIGNFDQPSAIALLRQLRRALRSEDGLLIGFDLVKAEADLELAYDDPLGVTAAFNRNLLVRINQELGGRIDLEGFAHRAVWDAAHARVEMRLVSLRDQRVSIPAAGVDLALRAGDFIWTESSYKFTSDGITALLDASGFVRLQDWVDADARYALVLAGADRELVD
jgi:dimethylhistidine N-methyltransferase